MVKGKFYFSSRRTLKRSRERRLLRRLALQQLSEEIIKLTVPVGNERAIKSLANNNVEATPKADFDDIEPLNNNENLDSLIEELKDTDYREMSTLS